MDFVYRLYIQQRYEELIDLVSNAELSDLIRILFIKQKSSTLHLFSDYRSLYNFLGIFLKINSDLNDLELDHVS